MRTVKEIAELTGKKEGTVRSWFNNYQNRSDFDHLCENYIAGKYTRVQGVNTRFVISCEYSQERKAKELGVTLYAFRKFILANPHISYYDPQIKEKFESFKSGKSVKERKAFRIIHTWF